MLSVVDTFQKVFLTAGYKKYPASLIFPCLDPTTLFTSATISVLKNHLLAGAAQKVFVIQPCLRTQNLKQSFCRDFDPEYLSSFVMFGILCSVGEFNLECIYAFFDSFPGLTKKILMRSSKIIGNEFFRQIGQQYLIEYDTRDPCYYKWQYGNDSLSGIGSTFAIEQPDGDFLDVGNLVLIHKHGKPIAMEFGFGMETFIARMTGRKSPYAASQEYLRLGLGLSNTGKRIGDCLIVALKLFEHGVIPGTGKASSIMRKALRNTCFLVIKDYGSVATEKFYHISRQASANPLWLKLTGRTYGEVQTAISAFTRETTHIKKHASGYRLEQKIREYRLQYGIPEQF